jgi:hypothetical protein
VDDDLLTVAVANNVDSAGDVFIDIEGQTAAGPRGAEIPSQRLDGGESAEFNIKIAAIGLTPEDESASFGVTARAVYDDGRRFAESAGSHFVRYDDGFWSEKPMPALDPTVSSVGGPAPGPDANEPLLMSRAEVIDAAAHAGISAPPNARFFNDPTASASPEESAPEEVGGGGQSPLSLINVNFCFNQRSQYLDGGVGEDFWTETALTYRAAQGLLIWIIGPGGTAYFGYLNGSGCTGAILDLPTGTYSATVASAGSNGAGKVVEVYTWPPPDTSVEDYSFSLGNLTTGGIKTYNFYPSGSDFEEFNIAAAANYALYYNPGDTNNEYEFMAQADVCQNAGGYIKICTNYHDDKWMIGHEQGHEFFTVNASVVPWGTINSYAIAETDVDCDSTSNSHNIETKEYVGSAFAEAAASFFAALTWNNTTATNGWFGHPWFGDVDIESGQVDLVLAYMNNRCNPGSAGVAGMGTEIDWLRQLWDVRTNASRPTMNNMYDWMDYQGATMNTTNVYTKLDTAANNVGGNVNTNWDAD